MTTGSVDWAQSWPPHPHSPVHFGTAQEHRISSGTRCSETISSGCGKKMWLGRAQRAGVCPSCGYLKLLDTTGTSRLCLTLYCLGPHRAVLRTYQSGSGLSNHSWRLLRGPYGIKPGSAMCRASALPVVLLRQPPRLWLKTTLAPALLSVPRVRPGASHSVVYTRGS